MSGVLSPTPYPEVNALLQELHARVRETLGNHLVGMYLEGSLTSGDFDEDSDIDFVVVTDEDVSPGLFLALQAMHERIAALDSVWAVQLEGSYISRQAIRRYDPLHALHPNIERGVGERLKLVDHDEAWAIHRYILRERGITLSGPPLKTLIDPVDADELHRAMQPLLEGWLERILAQPDLLSGRGYQSYTVLSLCRILYTLRVGGIASKRSAANWARETLGEKWRGLIERAWEGRHVPHLPADAEDIEQTLALIRFTRAVGGPTGADATGKAGEEANL